MHELKEMAGTSFLEIQVKKRFRSELGRPTTTPIENKEQKEMLGALSKGIEVVTSGGLLGKVIEVDDNFVKLEVGDNTFVQVQRHAIANMMPKGTYKTAHKKAKSKS